MWWTRQIQKFEIIIKSRIFSSVFTASANSFGWGFILKRLLPVGCAHPQAQAGAVSTLRHEVCSKWNHQELNRAGHHFLRHYHIKSHSEPAWAPPNSVRHGPLSTQMTDPDFHAQVIFQQEGAGLEIDILQLGHLPGMDTLQACLVT